MSEQSGRVVRLIELEKLIPFEKHPFVVREDEQMKMLPELCVPFTMIRLK